ncbi:hypothetical protein GCM10011410_16360 [Hoyosella rhizosphaerae]|uniref:DUF4328 domain-containing protein n=2 Tax=Hoyosella rhizosphaerae TaxID=1755582 RepID=A0A916XDT7_9ACTN|nr:hypothetical protein GCM10011410_16360 [Hoyosella rhizosphaerae]
MNFRWTAKPPPSATSESGNTIAQSATQLSATPRYRSHPHWGLEQHPVEPAPAPKTTQHVVASYATYLLAFTAALYGAAAVAELIRYFTLLYNRTRLIPLPIAYTTDLLVVTASIAALVFAFLTVISCASWLINFRNEMCHRYGLRETRSTRWQFIATVLPPMSWFYPPTLLAELIQNPRVQSVRNPAELHNVLSRIKQWWTLWVLTWLFAGASIIWRTADTVQAQANSVLFAVIVNVVASTCALLAWNVIRVCSKLVDVTQPTDEENNSPKRWIVASSP